MAAKPIKTLKHPLGGKVSFYRTGDRIFSLLDNDYPHADDFEVHERVNVADDAIELEIPPLSGTERRFDTEAEAIEYIESRPPAGG